MKDDKEEDKIIDERDCKKVTFPVPSEIAYGKDLVLRLLLYIHSKHVQSCLQLGTLQGIFPKPQEAAYNEALIEEARSFIGAK